MAAEHVLIVEDDPEVREMMGEYLATHGYRVTLCANGEAMREAVAERWLRGNHDVAIIMVTAAAEVVDRVVGLEVGADDYLAKPFDPRELRARLKSVLRRTGAAAKPAKAPPGRRIKVGTCTLDLDTHRLLDAKGEELPLTSMEFDLLRVFAERPNQVLSRDQLLTHTRNREWEPFDRSIDIRIARLRKKIELDPEKPRVIKTIRGAGYLFIPD
jgi:two-component system OmpR family response regulator